MMMLYQSIRKFYVTDLLSCGIITTMLFEVNKMVEKKEVSISCFDTMRMLHIYTPKGYPKGRKKYPVLYMFHGIGGDYTSWLEYGNVARVMDKMIKKERLNLSLWLFLTAICLITVTPMMAVFFMRLSLLKNWFHILITTTAPARMLAHVQSLVSLWEDSEHCPSAYATVTYLVLLLRYHHLSVQKTNI